MMTSFNTPPVNGQLSIPWDKEFRSRLWRVQETGDVLDLTYVQQLQYEHWMNICRRMQAVIDRDGGKALPQAQSACKALKAALVGGRS